LRRSGIVVLSGVLFVGCASSDRLLWEEYTSAGVAAVDSRHYARAEMYFNRALLKAENLGPEERGISLNGLGETYRRQGRTADAEKMYKRALAVKEVALGPDHPDVATTLTNLGVLYAASGRDQDAVPVLERSLSIREKRRGSEHPTLRPTLLALAAAYQRLGRAHDAFVMEVRLRLLRPE